MLQQRRGMAMKRFALILFSVLILLALPAQAQESVTLSNLEVALWPEFDTPEVLVIYRGVFDSATSLPVPVEIRIPASAGQPTAVAYVDQNGQRFNQQYITRVEGDWLVVSFELAEQGFQLEYYDTLPVDSSGQREYTFDLVADYPITLLNLEFQAPPTAEAFTLEPAADAVVPESDGLVYHQVNASSVAQGDEQSWTFAYQKDNEDLTISVFQQPEAPAPSPAPSAGGSDSSTVLLFLVAFVALVAVGGAAFWLGHRTQPVVEASPPLSRRNKRRGSGRGSQPRPRGPAPSGLRDTFFCYQCGAELRPDSEFCHKCGTVVRAD